MTLFPLRRQSRVSTVDGPFLPERMGAKTGGVYLTEDAKLRHSAVWACRRLRANLISTLPIDVFRKAGDQLVEFPLPPVLVDTGGKEWDYNDWMWASQWDLDGVGNAIGLITEKNALGLPSRIDLQAINKCQVIRKKDTGRLEYRIDGKIYQPDQVWHEMQYRISGLDVGLSPLAYAAWSIGEYLSMQDFALQWFGGAAVPKARMKNKEKKVNPKDSAIIKERYQATVHNGDLFVYGSDWEYDFIQAEQAGQEFIEGRRFGLPEICRFLDCDPDLIAAAISAPGSLTYQSHLERNVQFLIMALNPAIVRREKNLSKLLPRPRFVKLNTDALLRLDPKARGELLDNAIKSRRVTPDEARALENRAPLTEEQYAQFERLFGAPRTNPAPGQTPDVKTGQGERELAGEDRVGPLRVLAEVGYRLDEGTDT